MKAIASLPVLGGALALAFAFGLRSAHAQLAPAVQASQQILQETEASQKRIEQLDTQTQSLLNDYRATLKQLEQLKRYNVSQQRQIEAQEREIEATKADVDNVSSLQRSVQPLIEDMLDGLKRLVEADVPFQPLERANRIARLEGLMNDPGQSPAQRYRLIVEAYQIENEYGRTLEAYRGDIEANGQRYTNAEFLRVGRLVLIFKTDDDGVLKIYDRTRADWVDLDPAFLGDVRTALRMAKEQIPPDLLRIPVSAPEAATGQEG